MDANISRIIRIYFITLTVILLGFSGTTMSQTQVVGKIISKSDANTQFGLVLTSVTVSASQVNSWLTQTNNYVMFSIKNNQLYVLGDGRATIYPSGASVSPSEVFHLYSKSKVGEELSLGGSSSVTFEVRQNVFSITDGNYTLEFGGSCPPYCY